MNNNLYPIIGSIIISLIVTLFVVFYLFDIKGDPDEDDNKKNTEEYD
jgi:hypothetical protein